MKTSVNTHKKKIYRVRYIYPKITYPKITAWFPINQKKLEHYLYPTIIFDVQNLEDEEMEKIHEFLNGEDKECILLALNILKNKCKILTTFQEDTIYEWLQGQI